MALIESIAAVSTSLQSWLTSLSKRNEKLDAAHRDAVEAISAALVSTIKHLADLRDKPRATAKRAPLSRKEETLAHMWMQAANRCRSIDRSLSDLLWLKGVYWSDPRGWNASELDNARISLDNVKTLARRLLAAPRATLDKRTQKK